MKRLLITFIIITLSTSFYVLGNTYAYKISEDNISSYLLNSSDKGKICNFIKTNYPDDDNELLIHLKKSRKNGKAYLEIFKSDGTIISFLVNEEITEKADSECDITVIYSIANKDEIENAVDFLIGTYNAFFILRTQAEDQLGRLVHFYYGNFDKSNIAYEAIAVDVYGDIYFIGDDVVKPIESIDLY